MDRAIYAVFFDWSEGRAMPVSVPSANITSQMLKDQSLKLSAKDRSDSSPEYQQNHSSNLLSSPPAIVLPSSHADATPLSVKGVSVLTDDLPVAESFSLPEATANQYIILPNKDTAEEMAGRLPYDRSDYSLSQNATASSSSSPRSLLADRPSKTNSSINSEIEHAPIRLSPLAPAPLPKADSPGFRADIGPIPLPRRDDTEEEVSISTAFILFFFNY